MEPSPALEARIRRKVAALERLTGGFVTCHVTVERRHQHHRKGQLFHIGITLSLPGGELVASKDDDQDRSHEDPYVAVRDAFRVIRRRHYDWQQRRRQAIKQHAAPPEGRVTVLFPFLDYGTIRTPDGREVYFHRNAVLDGFDRIQVGDVVRFELHEPKGEPGPHASSVHLVGRPTATATTPL